jgi:hypothetical protein
MRLYAREFTGNAACIILRAREPPCDYVASPESVAPVKGSHPTAALGLSAPWRGCCGVPLVFRASSPLPPPLRSPRRGVQGLRT